MPLSAFDCVGAPGSGVGLGVVGVVVGSKVAAGGSTTGGTMVGSQQQEASTMGPVRRTAVEQQSSSWYLSRTESQKHGQFWPCGRTFSLFSIKPVRTKICIQNIIEIYYMWSNDKTQVGHPYVDPSRGGSGPRPRQARRGPVAPAIQTRRPVGYEPRPHLSRPIPPSASTARHRARICACPGRAASTHATALPFHLAGRGGPSLRLVESFTAHCAMTRTPNLSSPHTLHCRYRHR